VGLTPAQRIEADNAAQTAAGRTYDDNLKELTGKERLTEPIGEQKPGTNKEQTDAGNAQEKTLTDKLKTPAGIALIAALSITLAVTLAFIAKAVAKLHACIDCRDFKITITSIKSTPSTIPLIGQFLTPSTVDVSYTCPTDYVPIAGKETFTFKDTGIPGIDDQTFVIEQVLGKNSVQIKCGSSDCSAIDGKKGAINPNCADFNDQFNEQVKNAAKGTGEVLGSVLGGIFKNMGTFLFIIGVCFVAYFAITAFSKSS